MIDTVQLTFTELDPSSLMKNSDLPSNSESMEGDFFQQFTTANGQVEAELKKNGASPTIPSTNNKEHSLASMNKSGDEQTEPHFIDDEHTEPHFIDDLLADNNDLEIIGSEDLIDESEEALIGSDMLEQINAANNIDTSINVHLVGHDPQFDINQLMPVAVPPKEGISPIIDDPIDVHADDLSLFTTATLAINKMSAQESEQNLSQMTTVNDDEMQTSILTSVTKLVDNSSEAIESDELLAGLTLEQNEELKTQLQSMASETNATKATTLKDLLSQYVSANQQTEKALPSDTPSQLDLNKELASLSNTEKSQLLGQLKSFVDEKPINTEQTAQLHTVIADLDEALNTQSKISTNILANNTAGRNESLVNPNNINFNNIDNNSNVVAEVASDIVSEVASEIVADDVIQDEQALLSSLVKAEKINENMGLRSERVTQLFSEITTTMQTQTDIQESIEQQFDESQLLQSQQLQANSQTKQTGLDSEQLQTVSLIKSDAAKMLQERVSTMLSINNKEAEIRLDPPEMGSMQIRIRSDAEQAQINFVVQNQQAKEALEQSMPKLRDMLAQQGIELGESSISQEQSGSAGGNGESENNPGFFTKKEAAQDENNTLSQNTLQSSRQQTSSSIDYYA
ncbi:flagellar hook-length control protein FliK [Pseudoalteromonas sp. MMG010]|uniref:flagellar hook-length control protein FliK n=1 Tax=Pseudoalteromonas sp. MMG010 TaxID=2822685 RepID=UPI001B3A2154|nr:flagellar hook-length control protein FliK [Pseudoalteromonas sp. MMG010]MBQ4831782.1 flagellar hook-length control protein FliK [Pseudoalteromonas sp. MMG010]